MTSEMAFFLCLRRYMRMSHFDLKVVKSTCFNAINATIMSLRALINWFRQQGRLQFTNQPEKQIWPYYVFNLNCMISRPNCSTLRSTCGFIRDDPLNSEDGGLLPDTTYLSSALMKTLENFKECRRDQRFASVCQLVSFGGKFDWIFVFICYIFCILHF